MPELEVALRLVGFATALIGTCAAVPAAALEWLSGVRARLTGWLDNLRARVKRLAQRLRRHRQVTLPGETVTATSAIGVGVSVTASGQVVGNTIEERVDYLEK